MKKLLITGGPVHANLDDVKIITNRFKGGLMIQLALNLLAYDTEITYLCAPQVGAVLPQDYVSARLKFVRHDGLDDYRQKVLALAPQMDAVILGAAVANLVPVKPFAGKFPSHNYQPGDVIPIDFTIASRVIDQVSRVAPRTHLFGYKLLSGVSHEELIQAAYGIVLEAKATAVFANDAANLQQKFAVTKERGVHPLSQTELAPWIWQMINDDYYGTRLKLTDDLPGKEVEKITELILHYQDRFLVTEGGLIFGTVAVRHGDGFLTTGRGKRELDAITLVTGVDHQQHVVAVSGPTKATLNAPLLSRLFGNPLVQTIVHYHQQEQGLPSYDYAPSGTVRDSERLTDTSFNIREHGCMLLFDAEGRRL